MMLSQQPNFPEQEKEILKFWEKEKIFKKSLDKTKKCPRFIFYEGPPFANGLPGIHHLLARAFKDTIIRYKTMRGFFVERKAGWDTHGLPTEIAAEKKLGIKTKSDIEKIGVEKFIEACKENIFTYKKEWEEFTHRIGYWLDFKNAYITCKNDYVESLWWILKKIWEKNLLYEDYKVVPYCPRCGTSLSSHELAQGYKKVPEKSIFFKLKVKSEKLKTTNKNLKLTDFEDAYFLVWTTTPWTLPGNVALAIGEDIDYVLIDYPAEFFDETQKDETIHVKYEKYIISKEFNKNKLKWKEEQGGHKIKPLKEFKGKDLLNLELEYEPLYDFIKPDKPAYKVIAGDFVTTEEGTGIVHIAPAFGEDDMKAGKENDLPVLMPVNAEGKFKKEITPWAGMAVKNANGNDANPLIIKDLEKRNLLFSTEMYEHDYPFCWRCNSPLIYFAKNSWFIKMTEVRKQLLGNNEKINWIPKHIKKGRFGEWLNEVKDWNLTRERYWGTPLPVWKCQKCGNIKVIGSIEELEKLSNEKIQDLHRPHIDKVVLKCECGEKMKRVVEVIDCWFDSGAMPFAQQHYPFENKERIDKGLFFPADFICEGIDQTRGWFYTLLAISTLLELDPAYKNVISLGLVLDSNGQKMSKSKGNIVKPQEVIDKFGADCARFYFYTINQTGEPKKFDMKEIQDLSRKFFGTLQNSYTFFETYVDSSKFKVQSSKPQIKTQNLLDRWIISRLNNLNFQVVKNLDNYNIVSAARLFENFIDDLSNWYIRRSRKRFQKPKDEKEKNEAAQTLHYVFLNLVKLLAPFTPFISETIYQKLGMTQSVHLCDWPKADENLIDEKLEERMKQIREITAQALALRAKNGIKVRQPLNDLRFKIYELKNEKELLNLIKEEINVKEIIFKKKIKSAIELDTKITPELREEGIAREIARLIQSCRKKAGFVAQDLILTKIILPENGFSIKEILKKRKDYIKQETNSCELKILSEKINEEFDFEKEFDFENKKLCLRLKKK